MFSRWCRSQHLYDFQRIYTRPCYHCQSALILKRDLRKTTQLIPY